MAATVAAIVAKQDELLGLISRAVINYIKLETKKRTPTQVETRLENLSANWKKYLINHDQLSQIKPEDRKDLPYFADRHYDACEEAYTDARSDLLDILHDLRPPVDRTSGASTSNESQGSRASTARQLPRIPLPSFSGSYTDWVKFRDLFTSMVRKNTELADVGRLHFLNLSVTGEAAQLIKNIAVTDDNFARAWDTLVARYENKRILINTHLALLFSIRQVAQQSASELKALLGTVREAVGALQTLGCPTDQWDHILVFMVASKLDSASLIDWEKQLGARPDPAPFADLEKFLLANIPAYEAYERTSGTNKPRQAGSKATASATSHQAVAAPAAGEAPANPPQKVAAPCSQCSSSHYISSCSEFRNKTLDERREIVSQKGLCYSCLGSHQYRNCHTSKRCQICGNPHHTLLHRQAGDATGPDNSLPVQKKSSSPAAPPESASSANEATASANEATVPALPRRDNAPASASASSNSALTTKLRYTPVLLATALVKTTSRYDDEIEVRALLDQGSEVSFMMESLAQRLNHPRRHVSLPISGIGAQKSSVSKGMMTVDIASRLAPLVSLSVNAYILAKLTSYLPPIHVFDANWPHLNGIDLADPSFPSSREIDLVLGVDVYSRILEDGLIKSSPSSPVAQRTSLGWVLSGPISHHSPPEAEASVANGLQCSVDHQLLDLLQNFWLQEETTTSKQSSISEDETECEQHFADTHTRTPEGRDVVRLPFKRLPEMLGNSRKPALSMLYRQEKRFEVNAPLKAAYAAFLDEYEALDHMKLVPDSLDEPSRACYLPHHAVIRETSSTTKVRVVFNGSQRTNFGFSLNDLLHVGPKLQTGLADVIMRWRRHQYVFSADIGKMYRRIRIHPDDRDFQRILWRRNPEEPVRSFRLSTVTYGLASAPYTVKNPRC